MIHTRILFSFFFIMILYRRHCRQYHTLHMSRYQSPQQGQHYAIISLLVRSMQKQHRLQVQQTYIHMSRHIGPENNEFSMQRCRRHIDDIEQVTVNLMTIFDAHYRKGKQFFTFAGSRRRALPHVGQNNWQRSTKICTNL